MKQVRTVLLACLLAFTLEACDQTIKHESKEFAEQQNGENFNTTNEQKLADYIVDAIENNYANIKLAELANTKSTNKKLQDFAQQVVGHHSKTLEKLQAVAGKKNITIPAKENERTKKTLNALAENDSADFDKKWCDEMIARRKKTIRVSDRMMDRTTDATMKEIITRSLEVAEVEVAQLQRLEKNEHE